MKKTLSLSLLFTSCLILFLTLTFSHTSATTSSPEDFQISQLDHAMEIYKGGLVVIRDTIRLSATGEDTVSLQNFSVGFPFQFSSNLDYCFAYEASNSDVRHEVVRDVGLGRIGFYGINVVFPGSVEIAQDEPYELTVTFVFSNLVSQQNSTTFIIHFPLYPSLVQEATTCNVTVTLPETASVRAHASDFSSHVFTVATTGSVQTLNHTRSSLENFANEPAWLKFNQDDFPIIEVSEVKRQITLDQWGNLFLTDQYQITNKATETLSKFNVRLPQDAYSPSALDALGSLGASWPLEEAEIDLRNDLNQDEKSSFSVAYQLPSKNYVDKYGWSDYKLTLNLFESFDWTIRKLIVIVTLPEGAEFQDSSRSPHSVERGVFQQTITLVFRNTTSFHDLNFDLTYTHLVFWASFRPTLLIGISAAVVAAIAFLWQAPRVPTVPPTLVSPKDLRRFVDIYEEKTRILRELEAIEQQALRGKISRRRYRVRKRTLESRLSVLSRDLTVLREKIMATGPRYAEVMRQIEVAETRLEGAKTDIRRVEARYRRGEISKEAYRRLLRDYYGKRDGAKTTIDGVLLRIREEIR